MKQTVIHHLEVLPWSGTIWILSYGSFSDDSRLQFWVHWIISESTWPFWTKLHIQGKLMDIYQFRMDISSEESLSCQNPELDSELIRLWTRVLEKWDYLGNGLIVLNQIAYSSKTRESCNVRILIWSWSDYLQIGLIVSNQIAYSIKTNGYMWWRVLALVRMLIWIRNWSDSASVL